MTAPWLLSALFAGLSILFLIAWLITAAKNREQQQNLNDAVATKAGLETSLANSDRRLEELKTELAGVRIRLEQEQGTRVAAETALKASKENIAEQKRLLADAEKKLTDVFGSLASESLSKNSEQFLRLAHTKLEGLQNDATNELEQRRVAIEGLVTPLQSSLQSLQQELGRVESARENAYGSLTTEVIALKETNRELRDETGSLATSLRQPRIKGNWGELTLRRAVELAGLSPHCDFVEQQTIDGEDGRLRPDMIVRLAGGAEIVVDAKVPRDAFDRAISAVNEMDRQAEMQEHARSVRAHISQLSSRSYWSQFPKTPDFVVLFMPAESLFSAALEQDRTLIEDALARRVILASPTTLIALLRSIAQGWRQEQIAENAERISALGRDLYEKIAKLGEHLADIKSGLEKANRAFNSAVGSLESRLLPSARKFKELGVQSPSEIQSSTPIETALREIEVASPTLLGDPDSVEES